MIVAGIPSGTQAGSRDLSLAEYDLMDRLIPAQPMQSMLRPDALATSWEWPGVKPDIKWQVMARNKHIFTSNARNGEGRRRGRTLAWPCPIGYE